jgi:hypothetical protein
MKGERNRLKELETENRALKIAVAEKTMAPDAMEKPVEIANKHYGTDFFKKNRTETISGTKEMKEHSIRFLNDFFVIPVTAAVTSRWNRVQHRH